MDDSEIEDLLRKVRPVEPPAQLRQRILAAPLARRAWPWIGAAAAALIATTAFHLAVGYEVGRADLSPPDTETQVADGITKMLGDDERARRMAEFILMEQTIFGDGEGDDVQSATTRVGGGR